MLHNLDDLLHTRLAVNVGIHKRATQADGLDTKRQEHDGVDAVADAAVGEHLDLLEHRLVLFVHLERDLEGGRGPVELSAAVVGQDNGRDLAPDGLLGVFDGHDALENDGQLGLVSELLVKVPLQRFLLAARCAFYTRHRGPRFN